MAFEPKSDMRMAPAIRRDFSSQPEWKEKMDKSVELQVLEIM